MKTLIVGVGSILRGDDGLGMRVIDELKKEKISDKTQATEHMIGDLNHKSNEYRGLLEKLKEEREDICFKIKNYVEIDDIKIQITLNY